MLEAGRYRLVEVIGRGGMGEVWRAEDTTLNRQVAVKLLLGETAVPEAVERFRQEARTAAALNHPHVLAVYDFGEEQGRCYLVMELVHGRSLRAELTERGGSLPVEDACRFAQQAAAGLAAAHHAGVVHRDIKPGNLLLAENGVKVADFGIAQVVGQATAALTATGEMLGTSSYLAPERGKGASAGPESDVYALGCVLYELLCGRPPFTGNVPAVIYQHIEAVPEPPRLLRPEIPAGVAELALETLAKDAAARPTAAQVAERLEAARLSAGAPPAAEEVSTERFDAHAAVEPPSGTRRRRRTAALVAASIAVFAASVAVGYDLVDGDAKAPASQYSPSTPSSFPSAPSTPAEREDAVPTTAPTSPVQNAESRPAEDTEKAEKARKKAVEEQQKAAEEADKQQGEAAKKAAEEEKKAAEETLKRQEEAAKKAAEEAKQ